MRAPAVSTLAAAVLLVSCGGADLDEPTVKAQPPPQRPLLNRPAHHTGAHPTAGHPDRSVDQVTDGRAVVAIDPATGGQRTVWDDAAISLEGNWTVARRGRSGQLVRRLRRARPHR